MSVRLAAACSVVAVLTVSGAAAQPPAIQGSTSGRGQQAATHQVQGFNIVLVLGETQPSSRVEATEDLPAGAKKALSDMREFLPYKHYRVLDAQWTSCCGGINSVLSGQLRGIAAGPGGSSFVDRPYSFALTVNSSSQGLSVRFALADKADSPRRQTSDIERERDAVTLQRERADLRDQVATMELQVREMEKKVAVGVMAPIDVRLLQDKHASLVRQYEAVSRSADGSQATPRGGIIDSSFIMQPGETVVVGTSRLGGDRAIIALVTAARKPGGSR